MINDKECLVTLCSLATLINNKSLMSLVAIHTAVNDINDRHLHR